MTRDDARANLARWEAHSAAYRDRGKALLNDRGTFGWGIWHIPESEVGAGIRLFRENGLLIEDVIELRPDEGATTPLGNYVTHDSARDFPAEHIWKVRKEPA